MKLNSSIRGGLLLTSACVALAACGGSGTVENAGDVGSVTVVVGDDNTGGGSTTQPDGAVNFAAQFAGSCPAGTVEETRNAPNTAQTAITACVIDGTITADTTFTAGNVYLLDGPVFVGTATGSGPISPDVQATLTIEPGAVVAGLNGEDALIVSPGSQLIADGSVNQPIIFTSAIDLADADTGGDADDLSALQAASDGRSGGSANARGQWGGLVVNGLAPINDCENGSLDPTADQALCVKDGEGGSGLFGGDDPNDNSGVFRYIRVQYAGFLFSTDDELNGIAFQGVGDGTTVDYVQVHNNADDGVEFFGGTVDARHIVITGAGDDSIDWTDGWQGDLQYAVVVQTPGDANRGIEGDNRGGDNGIQPQSMPNVANLTFVTNFEGDVPEGADDGIKLREGTGGFYANGIVEGYAGNGIDYDVPADFSAGFPTEGPRPTLESFFVANNGSDNLDSAAQTLSQTNVVTASGGTLNGLFSGPEEQAVPSADLSGVADLDSVDYIGAFADNVQDLAQSWLAGWTLTTPFPAAGDQGCPAGTSVSMTPVPAGRTEARVCTLPSVVSSDLTLTRGNLYELDGTVFVGTDAGPDAANPLPASVNVALTINPGVTLFGLNGEDALVVSRGSQLFSNGTEAFPVVMTSLEDLNGEADASDRGQWGGLVINGRAPINDCEIGNTNADSDLVPGTVECEKDGEGGSGLFGGNDPEDDSGSITYTRVQYAGFLFSTDDELNGIAFQGVGSGTNVDYIQVHNNADDGVEFFGGTVSAKHIIITGAGDDSIDWTDGWTGNIQYAIVVQTSGDANRGIEGDNRGGDNGLVPQSNPWISNFTFVTNFGGDVPDGADDGVKLREGTDGRLSNGIVVNYVGNGFDYDTPADFSAEFPTAGSAPELFSTYVAGNGSAADSDGTPIFNATGAGNVAGTDATLLADTDGTAVPLLPNTEITTTVTADDTDGAAVGTGREDFFDDADYVGAINGDADNWYVGWTFSL